MQSALLAGLDRGAFEARPMATTTPIPDPWHESRRGLSGKLCSDPVPIQLELTPAESKALLDVLRARAGQVPRRASSISVEDLEKVFAGLVTVLPVLREGKFVPVYCAEQERLVCVPPLAVRFDVATWWEACVCKAGDVPAPRTFGIIVPSRLPLSSSVGESPLVCMCVCMHVCMYACMHVCMCACVHVCMRVCVHACMYACVHACSNVDIFVVVFIVMGWCAHSG